MSVSVSLMVCFVFGCHAIYKINVQPDLYLLRQSECMLVVG